ncbi:lipid-A-disaccharide synthase [Blochmannia endosymbiont of Camponotus sp. C-003]|uniref:lipid-A-disaccharide synthase n=1 Tax=unclassified Candidatus Blochmanniella TaxID=711328 RepID=UPI0020242E3E|nr:MULTISPECIES: lipid-A-disaccharide synthase [unclassified Candidatus Blochmannia]URJ23525.1 lipid-A-disaccharide synthase [Blochmannia endosymbiont of Camponotus sp. C-003]URJ28997.1 lipid-A-disaccharide synthase [Blochmannia endosymbiont of Camponotus sp. C-046]
MHNRTIIIGIVAGEASGDILGAGLIRALKKYLKKVCFFGIGGPCMQSEHMKSWYNIEELSVMGFAEIILKLPRLLHIRRNLARRFINLKPDVFIGIDSPDFNISLENRLKKHGIRTIHYVSPSVWAWRKKRIFALKKATDNILVTFPFEKKIYDHFNIPCQFIGHTLADQIPLNPNKVFARQKLGIPCNVCCLAILPGSRIREIKMLAHDFLLCAKLLKNNFPNLEILVPLHNQTSVKKFISVVSTSIKYRILNNNQSAWEIIMAADVSLVTAGTATLECMLVKCPMVVAYRMHPLTFMLVKHFINVPWISLPNLLADRELVKEFIQNNCRPENLAQTLIDLLNDDNNQHIVLKKTFRQLHYRIRCKADEQAAHAVLRLIK